MKRRILLWAVCALLLAATNASAELVGWWSFNDGTAADGSGKGNNGEFFDGAGGAVDVPPVPAGGAGSAEFAAPSYIRVPHDPSLNIESDITIAAWVKPVGNVAWDGVIAKNPTAGSGNNHAGNFELRIERNARHMEFLWEQGTADSTTAVDDAGNAIPAEEWTHLAFTGSAGGDYQFYINGEPTSGGPLPDTFGNTNENDLYIGNRADLTTIPMDGFIDDVFLYNHVLNQGEIQDIMQNSGGVDEFVRGDFNRDAVVDVDDFFILSDNMATELDGIVPTHDNGDIDFDRDVDLDDYDMFLNLFPGVVAAALRIPEPSTSALALLLVAGMCPWARRRGTSSHERAT